MWSDIIYHLSVLRGVLIRLAIYLMISGYFMYEYITDDTISYILHTISGQKIVYMNIMDAFNLKFYVSILLAVCICLPLIITEALCFIWSGLKKSEKHMAVMISITIPILFTIGAYLGFKYVLPLVLQFFISFNATASYEQIISINQYVDFVILFCIVFGAVFEYPLIILAVVKLNLLSIQFIKQFRKYNIIVSFIIGAIITPPDALSQCIVAMILIILYEVGIFLFYLK